MKPDKVVNVRDLRAHLSRYLRDVAAGEIVTIGSRGRRPIARLVPVEDDPEREKLSELAEAGVIKLGAGKPGSHRPVRSRRSRRTVAEIVIEDRR
jgi:prevent-host-death family protein